MGMMRTEVEIVGGRGRSRGQGRDRSQCRMMTTMMMMMIDGGRRQIAGESLGGRIRVREAKTV